MPGPRMRSELQPVRNECGTCGYPDLREDSHASWCIGRVYILNVRQVILIEEGEVVHGVAARYGRGCRCGPCRMAWKLYCSDHEAYPHAAQVV